MGVWGILDLFGLWYLIDLWVYCMCVVFFSPVFKRLLGLFHWVFGLSFVFFGILDLLRVLGLLIQRLKPNNHNFDPYSGPVFFVKVKSIRGSLFYRFIVRENIVLTHVFFTFFTPTLVFSKTLFLNFKG